MMYHSISSKLSDEGRLQLDALLGDPDAQAEVDEQRMDAVAAAGGDVG